jgi:hypothetical protein
MDQSNDLNDAQRLNGLNANINQVLGNESVAEEMRRRISAAASSKDNPGVKARPDVPHLARHHLNTFRMRA